MLAPEIRNRLYQSVWVHVELQEVSLAVLEVIRHDMLHLRVYQGLRSRKVILLDVVVVQLVWHHSPLPNRHVQLRQLFHRVLL